MAYGYVTSTNGFTLEGWFYRGATVGNDYEALCSQQTQANPYFSTAAGLNGRHFWFGIEQTSLSLYLDVMSENNTARTIWTDPSPTGYGNDSQWHHWALRCEADEVTFRVFLDAKLVATISHPLALNWKPGVLTFGGSYAPHLGNWGNYPWNHRLAYLAAFNTALSDNQIAVHYAAGSGGSVYYGDTETVRLSRILDWAEVPVVARSMDAALTTLQGIQVTDTNALEKAQETVDQAMGLMYVDGQARVIYHNRRRRYNRWTLATLSESLGSAPEIGMEFSMDDTYVYNDLKGERAYGATVRVLNEVSKAAHGKRSYKLSMTVTSDTEMRNALAVIYNKYGTDRLRISGVVLSAHTSDRIQRFARKVKPGDVVIFDELPEDAPVSTLGFTVEGISLAEADFREGTWVIGLHLSPGAMSKVFEVGRSVLGDGSMIAF